MNAFMFLFTFVASVLGLPHVAMIDTPAIRDVGLIFDDRYYKGNSTFIFELRDKPTCIPINVDSQNRPRGFSIKSVQVCKPTTCAFFTGDKCTSKSTGTFSVTCKGPGDVPNHDSNDVYKSYICGQNISKRGSLEDTKALVTVPHNFNAGMV
ncbi:hypothetical protein DPSP01_009671 [Paraphaeosphaeria sporulosa]|uniref:Uncharacterized protein n=1 Tax=Paraphaeosphaeria sporulosa TaxID=1460663 RepID=A0A177CW79_9PLEO|nr:uncharacterized protein CC84DRAFT_1238336 [Paraphaeosphaeria sporulosa]OAG11067.1 hypothetical protein CC84DRAFT_1238336 [Paraphaeosphaeria sporulosa]